MDRPSPDPPERDRALGLGFYVTSTPGVDFLLKETPEAFRVAEISAYPFPDPAGPFTVLRVASRDWEQHELSARLAARLGLPPHALAWAGTKDRRAVAERLASYRGPPPALPVELPGATVVEAYRARDGLVLGHHFGNSFAVQARRAGGFPPEDLAALAATLEELRRLGGFANLFGPQRFGEVRPITHEVGRALVRGDPAAAVEVYLTALPDGPAAPGAEARRAYAATHDAGEALRAFPPAFRFERQLLDHLARGHAPDRALRALSRELRTLFVHAYQALLFNRWLSRRHARGIPLTEPVAGDRVLRLARDGTVPGTNPIPVSDDNLPEAGDLVRRGRGVVAGPLVGFETPVPDGVPGEILRSVLAEESVAPGDFRLPSSPDLASRGTWRPIRTPLPPVGLTSAARDATGRAESVTFHFSLPKGSYATVLLREFAKSGSTSAASRTQFSNT